MAAAVALASAVAAPATSAPRPRVVRAAPDVVPARGALLGAWVDLDGRWVNNAAAQAEVATFEETIGRKLDIDQHYYSWTHVFPSGLEQWDVANGRIPLICWKPSGARLEDIADGDHDALVRARARGLRDLGAPVFLRWGHEMNGSWSSWGGAQNNDPGTHNGPAKYVAAYRHIHDVFEQEGATNVLWVWSPNATDVPREPWNHWTSYYPGDAYVDWVGPDGYNWGEAESWSSWGSFKDQFTPIYDDYAGRKPIMIAETGSAEAGGSKARWIGNAWYQMQVHMPEIKAFVYFNAPDHWPVTTSPSSLRAFRAMATSPHFTRTADDGAPRLDALRATVGDGAGLAFRSSEPARVGVDVRRPDGTLVDVVRAVSWSAPVRKVARWDLRDRDGRRVRAGRYRVDVTAADAAGHDASSTLWIDVGG